MNNDNYCSCSDNYGLGITQVAICPDIQMGAVQDFTGMFKVRQFIPGVTATYEKDSYIWYHGDFYQCLEGYTGSIWDSTKWNKTSLLDLIGSGGASVAEIEKLKKIIGSITAFQPGTTYNYGDFIVDGNGYVLMCIVDTASSSFIQAEWTSTDVKSMLTAVVNSIADINDKIGQTFELGTGSTGITLVDNNTYVWGEVGSLNISNLDKPSGGTYMVIFESGTPATVLTVAPNIIWNCGTLTIAANKKYCLGIIRGLGFFSEFDRPAQA